MFQVEEEDVEKMNVPSMDRVENVALLPFLNESSVLHVLRQRYGSNLVHTFAGDCDEDINDYSCLFIRLKSWKIIAISWCSNDNISQNFSFCDRSPLGDNQSYAQFVRLRREGNATFPWLQAWGFTASYLRHGSVRISLAAHNKEGSG